MATLKRNKSVTLKDIALEVGVSPVAVSQALNNTGRISENTRQRVITAAKRLDYSPNLLAKSLRLRETRTIGVAVSDASLMFFAQVLRGIQDATDEAGYSIMVANTEQRPGKEKNVIDLLFSKQIDGLIIVSPTTTEADYIKSVVDRNIPIVVLMRHWNDVDVDTVISDNETGGFLAADYLLSVGCRNPYYLMLPEISQVGEDRLRGHVRALHQHGVPFNSNRIIRTIPSIEGGLAAMKKLLEEGFDGDSICCDCDLIATGAMHVLLDHGYKLPSQVRICGFNNLELSPYLRFPLTTIHQSRYEIGFEGVRLLVDHIKNQNRPTTKIVMPVKLIVRGST